MSSRLYTPQGLEAAMKNLAENPAILNCTQWFYDAFMIYQKRYNREINRNTILSPGHICMASSHYTNCYI